MNTSKELGFLILADITGFTPFVASTELEHSNEILHDILKGIVSFLTPGFTLAEVEGDAVFVYAERGRFHRGAMIFELIESAYTAFRDTKNTISRLKTCNCKACQMATSLDLKFVVHYGEYIMNNVSGKNKPLGNSVNVAHRLLKNSISEVTGWKAYALFTKECMDAISISTDPFHRQAEEFEHVGTIETFSIDLDALYRGSVKDRNVYLTKEDADVVIEREFPLVPALLWEWLNDPTKRTQWSLASDWSIGLRPMGRVGKGATNHCANSGFTEEILDYRPFDYYTSSMGRGFFSMTLTSQFDEIPAGTRLSWHIKINGILPRLISRFLCKLMLEKGIKVNESFDELARLIEKERRKTETLV